MTKAEKARIGKIKFECHRLMALMFPKNKGAYHWLRANTGINHFSEENDYAKLFEARRKLQARAIEYEYLTPDEITLV